MNSRKIRLGALAIPMIMAISVAGSAIPDAEGVLHGCAKNGSGTLRLIDTEAGQTCNANESAISWRSGPPAPRTIRGLINIDGTVALGTGFTSERTAAGDYLLSFPEGTWATFPVIVVSPFGLPGAFPVAEVGSVVGSGGAASAHVLVSATAGTWTPLDAAFWFIAIGS